MRAVATLVLLSLVLIVPSPDARTAQAPAPARRTMAVTIDDLPFVHLGDTYLPAARRGTEAILAALKKHAAPAVGFVNEVQLEAGGAGERAARTALLQQWVDAGHVLGNHTFSHPDANGLTVEAYLAEVDKGDVVTKRLMQARRPSYSRVRMALSDGHQCQPRRSKPRAMVTPRVSSGTGGVCRGDFGG